MFSLICGLLIFFKKNKQIQQNMNILTDTENNLVVTREENHRGIGNISEDD